MPQTNPGDKLSAVKTYFEEISGKLKTGQAREHSYRPAFEHLIKSIDGTLSVVNEPKRSEHGAPDFVFLKGVLTIGYAETKDIDVSLDKIEKTEQLERYLGYSNLILTNCLDFRFFRNGERYCEPIIIGELSGESLIDKQDQFTLLAETLADFLKGKPEQIKSGSRLARIMGGKARRIRDNVSRFLTDDAIKNEDLRQVYETVKKLLVHDLTSESFADMYAQTLVYGLFVARFHDTSQEPFTRQKARDLVPASNPFLRHFFDHIVGPDFDKRLAYIVGELCDVFSNTNVRELMEQYFKKDGKTEGPDPVIHFYEDFLKEYDAEQRKKLGAFYTPLPVVRFIVRSVDSILEKDFGLAQGLANTSKIEIINVVQNKKVKEQVHRVQILDPATGTGTFLNETVRAIHAKFTNQAGRWKSYVDDDLLPRLYGFELMMAPYTIAHLKLGMTLADTGYTSFNHRLGIYLTNSLEEAHDTEGSLFSIGLSQSIAEEAIKASQIKSQKPIMVVMGNPPYSVSSSNKGEWITDLIDVYKTNLNEKSYNALSDDYVKFIRFAEYFIEKNKTGIVAMITNNSFLDGVTHRQMRKHLLETFDDIYILDLHGNSKKKEVAPDGSKDENVFDIQQGVAISILVRTDDRKKGLGLVHHGELYGKRDDKFVTLDKSNLEIMKWNNLEYSEPYYFFVPKDFGASKEYDRGFKIDELFIIKAAGIKTHHDDVVIAYSEDDLRKQILDYFEDKSYPFDIEKIKPICYRPFDQRFIYYDTEIVVRHRKEQIKHSFYPNIALLSARQSKSDQVNHFFVTNLLSEMKTAENSTGSYHFPLFLYSEDGSKTPNLNKEILGEIAKIIGETSYEDIFDYIYAILYSPTYRDKYKAFLEIDFPRIPYPKNKKEFKSLVILGRELREIHLLTSARLNNSMVTYPIVGSNIVGVISYKNGNVFFNKDQYFGEVPKVAWDFSIGGYQPAQKWLKDRKGRLLTSNEIEHYQKMILALTETVRIMEEIDRIYT